MIIDNAVLNLSKDLSRRRPELGASCEKLIEAYCILKNCFFNDKILYICGNGGSAADSEHIVGELMKGFKLKRPLSDEMKKNFEEKTGDAETAGKLQTGLRAVSLLSHPALLSAYANDVDPKLVYAQQLFVMGREGDALIGLSTSGGAENVFAAFKVAKAKNITTILFTGENHGICEKFADCVINAPSNETYLTQEYHISLYHTLCLMLEETFYGEI